MSIVGCVIIAALIWFGFVFGRAGRSWESFFNGCIAFLFVGAPIAFVVGEISLMFRQ